MCQGGYLTEVNGAGGESISDETFVRKHTDGSLSMPNTVPDPSFITLQGTTASTPSVGFGITSTPAASGASTGPAVLGSTTAAPLVGNTTTSPAATTSPTTTPSAEARVPAEASISKNMPCAILDLKRRLDEQQARDRTSFNKLKGELEKLTSMAAQLATFIGKHTNAAILGSSPLEVTCTAPIAPKVYDTMPTPSSGYDNFSVHSDQSPAVQDGGTNPREQNLDELPQAYGLHNLNCRTVVRAEHNYYALPGDSPLERATPEPLFSKESVGVFASKPGQQPYEKEQQEGDRLLTCSSKALEIDSSGACLNIISDVHDLPLELQQQDDVKACNVPVLKTSDSVVTSSSKLSSALVLRGLRWLWDPGALLPLMTSTTQHYSPALQPASHATAQGRRDAVATYKVLIFQLPMSTNSHRWDPGDTTSYALFTTADSATNLQCTNVYKPAVVQILAMQFGVRRVLIFKSAIMHCDALGLARTKVNGSALFVLVVPCSTATSCSLPSFENRAKMQWDPGIAISSCMYIWLRAVKTLTWLQSQLFSDLQNQLQMTTTFYVWDLGMLSLMDMMLGKIAVANIVFTSQTPCNLRNFIGQLVNLKQFWAELLRCHTWHHTLNVFPKVQYCCPYSELVQQLVCYSHMLSSIEAILPVRCMSTAATVGMQLVLCSGEIAQEGRDVAVVYHAFKLQLQMRKISQIWDHECLGSHLHQISKWTSTTPNAMRSFEYGYTMHNLSEQWEFSHQQDIKKYCNEKNLLSSPNYLQSLEIDILFLTFLPP